jgi:opacity protein-like surface antigen
MKSRITNSAFYALIFGASVLTAGAAASSPETPEVATAVLPAPRTPSKPKPAPKAKPVPAPAAAPAATAPAKTTAREAAPAPAPVSASASAPKSALTVTELVSAPKRPREFLGLAIGGQYYSFDGENTKGTILYGATLSGGGYLSKEKSFFKNLLLTGEVGAYLGDWSDNVLNASGPYTPPSGPSWGATEQSLLKRKSEQFNVPVFLTLAYDFRLGDSFDLRFGPSIGFTFVSMKSKFDGTSTAYEPDGTYIGVTSRESESKSGSKVLFSYGLTLGLTWNLSQNWGIDLQYRLQGNSSLDLGIYRDYDTSVAHQLNLGAIYRF